MVQMTRQTSRRPSQSSLTDTSAYYAVRCLVVGVIGLITLYVFLDKKGEVSAETACVVCCYSLSKRKWYLIYCDGIYCLLRRRGTDDEMDGDHLDPASGRRIFCVFIFGSFFDARKEGEETSYYILSNGSN
jgi:hypothetical protein